MIAGIRGHARVAGAITALAAVLALGALGAAPASAHSQLTSTSPADGAVLDAPPSEVRLTFDAPLLDDTDTISINDENGNVVSSIHPKPQGDSVAIPWPAGTPAGTYQVAYRVVCGDGHPVVGAINVTLTAKAAAVVTAPSVSVSAAAASPTSASAGPSASAVAAGDAAPPATASALPLVAGAIALAAAAVVVVGLAVRRRRSSASASLHDG